MDPLWSNVLQCLRKFPVVWSCFLQDASKTQTTLESAISGPLFGPFLDPFSANSTLSFCEVVLCLAKCFRNSNSLRIYDFRHVFGPFLEQYSSMVAQISCYVGLLRVRCFKNSNSPRICDFRQFCSTLFVAMFFNVCTYFL